MPDVAGVAPSPSLLQMPLGSTELISTMMASLPSLAVSSPGGETGVGRARGPNGEEGNLGLLSPHPLFLRSLPEVPETIELEVRTSTANGLLLWQGVVSVGIRPDSWGSWGRKLASWWPEWWGEGKAEPPGLGSLLASAASALQAGDPRDPVLPWQEVGEAGRGKDFISLGLQDGHLVFRWVLAPGPSSPFPGPSTPPPHPAPAHTSWAWMTTGTSWVVGRPAWSLRTPSMTASGTE